MLRARCVHFTMIMEPANSSTVNSRVTSILSNCPPASFASTGSCCCAACLPSTYCARSDRKSSSGQIWLRKNQGSPLAVEDGFAEHRVLRRARDPPQQVNPSCTSARPVRGSMLLKTSLSPDYAQLSDLSKPTHFIATSSDISRITVHASQK